MKELGGTPSQNIPDRNPVRHNILVQSTLNIEFILLCMYKHLKMVGFSLLRKFWNLCLSNQPHASPKQVGR